MGLSDRLTNGGRLLMNGYVVPNWSMEFSVGLSNEEGKAIFGYLISNRMEEENPLDQFFEVS